MCNILILNKIQEKHFSKEKMSPRVFFNETAETFTFIKNNKGLMQLLIFAMMTNFLMVPMLEIIFPFALKKSIGFSADKYGYIFGFFTIGIVLGNIALAIYFKKLSNKRLMKTGFISQTIVSIIGCTFLCPKLVSTLGGASTKLFTILIISMFLVGFFNAFVNTPISTNFQKMVPEQMRSRFFSLQGMLIQAAVPIGSLIYGMLLDRIPYFYIILTVNLMLAVLVAYFIVIACDEAYEPAEAV